MSEYPVDIFSTCPQSFDVEKDAYIDSIRKVARWSEDCGFKGIMINNNGLMDPWLVSQVILENTTRLIPLLAIHPLSMHPYKAANMVASLGFMYNRQIYLNLFPDSLPLSPNNLPVSALQHENHKRLIEYYTLVTKLLNGDKPVTFDGDYFKVKKLRLSPQFDSSLNPEIFISGLSETAMEEVSDINITSVYYPNPHNELGKEIAGQSNKNGLWMGIIARGKDEAAWKTGYTRFTGQLPNHRVIKPSVEDAWEEKKFSLHKNLYSNASTHWLFPKDNSTFCPYLLGSYQNVAKEISRFIRFGFRTFILDIPPDREEIMHIRRSFEMALAQESC